MPFRISHDRLKEIAIEICEIFPGEKPALYFNESHKVTDEVGDCTIVKATGL